MTRWRLLAVAAILAVLAPAGATRIAVANHGAGQPNVLIIVTDDHRWDMMQVLKRTRRWFGAGGTTYPFAFATTPLCCPSRASIMTGQYAHNTNVETNVDAERLDQRATMQRYLQDAGYRTAIVGKYLNSWRRDPPYFNDFAIFPAGAGAYENALFNINGIMQRVERYSTDFIGARSIQVMRSFERNDSQPWLLYVTPFAPHAPYEPATRYRKSEVPRLIKNPAMQEDDRTDKPTWVQLKHEKRIKAHKVWQLQERMLLSVDTMVDKVMKAVDELGERSDTIVFFLGDNGFLLGEHGLQQKHSPYTASVKIPMYARWPGHFQARGVDDRLVANIDIAPTVYDAAGIRPDSDHPVDGRSLLDGSWSRDRMLLEYIHREDRAVPTWASLRTAAYQYVEYYDEELEEITFREYYDLIQDPYQLLNLLGDADPTNDPDAGHLTTLSLQLQRDRRCEDASGPSACP
ncbi:MAG: sulfatase family protein [Actinomycetota bacterium]